MTDANPLARVLPGLDNVRQNGGGYSARCPSHADRRNSLSIAQGEDGSVLLHCFAGCETAAIVDVLGLTMADLYPARSEAKGGNGQHSRIVARYDYTDESGALLYQVIRREPKDFRQRRPQGSDWTWSLGDVPRVLYRLPDLAAAAPAAPVLVTEGEKDADRLAELGFVATTNAGGAGKWRPEYGDALRGRRVCIVPDNDAPGEKHAAQVEQALSGVAAEIRVLRLPGLPAKGDVSDWLDAGGTPEELARLIESAPAWAPAAPNGKHDPHTIALRQPVGALASDIFPEALAWLWRGRLAAGKLTVLDGDPGLGKSTLTTEIAARISRGEALPGADAGEPRGVVLMSAEDGPADTIIPRLAAAGADLSRVYVLQGFRGPDGEITPLTVPGALDVLERAIRTHNAALAVIDPLMAFLGGDVGANRDQDVRRAMAPLAAMLERSGAACILVRHLNKAGGSSALYRGGGSIGIIGAARIGLLVARDPDDEDARILAPVKSNLSKPAPALRFRLESAPGSDVARVVWDAGPVALDADALLAAGQGDDEERSKVQEAADFLRDYLALGPRAVTDVYKDARPEQHHDATLKRAKRLLGIKSEREGFGPGSKVLWSLPDAPLCATDTPTPIQDQPREPVCIQDQLPRFDPVCTDPRNHAENGRPPNAQPSIGDQSPGNDPVWANGGLWGAAAGGEVGEL